MSSTVESHDISVPRAVQSHDIRVPSVVQNYDISVPNAMQSHGIYIAHLGVTSMRTYFKERKTQGGVRTSERDF